MFGESLCLEPRFHRYRGLIRPEWTSCENILCKVRIAELGP